MSQHVIILLSQYCLIAAACVGAFVIIIATIYDLRTIARRGALLKEVARLRYPRQPSVTVLVYAKNNGDSVAACLDSLSRSHYKNFDIVLVDNVSTDATKHVVDRYLEKHPDSNIYYYKKRKGCSQQQALLSGYKKSRRGELILKLDATSVIAPSFIKASVARFVRDPALQALSFNNHLMSIQNLSQLIGQLIRLNRNVYAKCLSMLPRYKTASTNLNAMLLASEFVRPHAKNLVSQYDGSLEVMTVGQPNEQLVVTRSGWKMILGIVWLVVITYAMVIAATLQNSEVLMLSWLIFAIWTVAIILSDEGTKIKEKIGLIFSVPALYFIGYVWGIVQIVRSLSIQLLYFLTTRTLRVRTKSKYFAERRL